MYAVLVKYTPFRSVSVCVVCVCVCVLCVCVLCVCVCEGELFPSLSRQLLNCGHFTNMQDMFTHSSVL